MLPKIVILTLSPSKWKYLILPKIVILSGAKDLLFAAICPTASAVHSTL
jgi:hypothetical protein